MGNITGSNTNDFISCEYLFSKIKREFKSFANANLIDDADFPDYVLEVLNKLGISTFKEDEAILYVKNKKAELPSNFKLLHAAYKCSGCNTNTTPTKHLQNTQVLENHITSEVLVNNTCEVTCEQNNKVIERVTIKQYVNDNCITNTYNNVKLLTLSPNVKDCCTPNCLNLFQTSDNEISINNKKIYTNFDNADIYIKYYGYSLSKDGMVMIPNIMEVEKACEWWIKSQILLNLWFTDELVNVQNKWQKAEVEFEKWMAEARYILKLPSFSSMVNNIRNKRAINPLTFFSQQDNNK